MTLDATNPIIDVLTGDRIQGFGIRVDAVTVRRLDRPSTAMWDEDLIGSPKPEFGTCAEAWQGGVCFAGAEHNTRALALGALALELEDMHR